MKNRKFNMIMMSLAALMVSMSACSDPTPDGDADVDTTSDGDADFDADVDEEADTDTESDVGEQVGCIIDGVLYPDGSDDPDDSCRICDMGRSDIGWSNAVEGSGCDDGVYCNGTDTCQGGMCVHTGNPCLDQSPVLTLCYEGVAEEDRCCSPQSNTSCNEDGDAVWLDSCGNLVAVAEDCVESPHGMCEDGECRCQSGRSGESCERCLVYVNGSSGNDSNDGMSWEEAKATVGEGLLAAADEGCEVWVVRGTYTPTSSSDRTATFQLVSGVDLYGGFNGTEFTRSQRDFEANETILSGNISGGRVHHVVTGADDALIDGFTISRGSATRGGETSGGGMINVNVSPRVSNCTFTDNVALLHGGGMYNDRSSAVVSACTFASNSVQGSSTGTGRGGAGMYNTGGDPDIINCTFTENSTSISSTDCMWDGGGAIYNDATSPQIIGCVFSNNTADLTCNNANRSGGGAIYNFASSPRVTNCTFVDNSAERSAGGSSWGGGAIHNIDDSNLTIRNSVLWGNTSSSSLDHIVNYDDSVTNLDYSAVELIDYGDHNIELISDPLNDLRPRASSPLIAAGRNSSLPADVADLDSDGDLEEEHSIDIDGNARVTGRVVDIGAFEHEAPPSDGPPSLVNVSGDDTQISAEFNERLDPLSATTISNYLIDGDVFVIEASLSTDERSVTLSTTPLGDCITYSLSVEGVADITDDFGSTEREFDSQCP